MIWTYFKGFFFLKDAELFIMALPRGCGLTSAPSQSGSIERRRWKVDPSAPPFERAKDCGVPPLGQFFNG